MSVNALLKPRSIEVETAEGNPYSATVTMEPFETGYAHTLGNALRRVLLSSMVGFAPTEAQIAGVVHEYSQIDGVKEDVVDILLNVTSLSSKTVTKLRSHFVKKAKVSSLPRTSICRTMFRFSIRNMSLPTFPAASLICSSRLKKAAATSPVT